MRSLITLTALAVLFFASCHAPGKSPLIAKDLSIPNERNNTLFVFVGEKIDVKNTYEKGDFSYSVQAKYKVLQRIYGDYAKDTIEFFAADHYQIPRFANYKNVLMFISGDSGKYYQEQYQWFDVYKTKNGRWAGAYPEYDYRDAYNGNTDAEPLKMDFVEEVSYPLKIKNSGGKEIEMHYPAPYYKTVGNKAIAVYGNYVEDLFKLKRDAILTRRGLFGDGNEKYKPIVAIAGFAIGFDSSGSAIEPPDSSFKVFWKNFTGHVIQSNQRQFREMVLDTLWVSDKMETRDKFCDCYKTFFNSDVTRAMTDNSSVMMDNTEIDSLNILPSAWAAIVDDNGYRFYRDIIIHMRQEDNNWIRLSFILTREGYKLYSCYNHKDWRCCR